MYRINTALTTLGLPPLIVEKDGQAAPAPMSRRFAAWYVAGFFAVYALGFAGIALLALGGHH
jgi:hypothetical protein